METAPLETAMSNSAQFSWVRDAVLAQLRTDPELSERRPILSCTGPIVGSGPSALLIVWKGRPGLSPASLIDRFLLCVHDPEATDQEVHAHLDLATSLLSCSPLVAEVAPVSVVRTGRWVERSSVCEQTLHIRAFEARVPRSLLLGRPAARARATNLDPMGTRSRSAGGWRRTR